MCYRGVNMAGKTDTVAPSFTGRLACHFATRYSPAPEVVAPSGTPHLGVFPPRGCKRKFSTSISHAVYRPIWTKLGGRVALVVPYRNVGSLLGLDSGGAPRGGRKFLGVNFGAPSKKSANSKSFKLCHRVALESMHNISPTER
jgi:hypothetical protein